MNELKIVEIVNHFGQNTFLDNFSYWISDIIFLFSLWLVISLLLLAFDKKIGRYVVITLILAACINFFFTDVVLHHLFMRLRPYEIDNMIRAIGPLYSSSSFPSGHMTSMTALVSVLVYYYRKLYPDGIIFLLIIGFTRVHNGMHYPSDVAFGIVFGFLYALLAIFIINRFIFSRKRP